MNSVFVDVPYKAAIGYVGSIAFNAIHGSRLFNPVITAAFFATHAITQRVIDPVVYGVVPKVQFGVGPIGVDSQFAVSTGLNLLAVFKILKVAGLVIATPHWVTTYGLSCAAITATCFTVNMIHNLSRRTA